jgi:autotransporter-associated beta strand protein
MRSLLVALSAVVLMASHADAQTFNVGANFQTANVNNSGAIPPDTQGAAGQNHIVALVNGRYAVFNKLGTLSQGISDSTLFSNAGYVSGGSSQYPVFGDPRIRFDPLTGRWFAVNFTLSPEANDNNNRIVLAVSAGADPTSSSTNWKSVQFQTSIGAFADFPTLGIDKNGLYIGTNNFPSNPANFSVSLFTMSKTGLLWSGAGTPSLSNFTQFQGQDENDFGVTLQATNNFDVNQTGTTNRVIAGYGPDQNNNYNFRTFNIQNTGGNTTIGTKTFVNTGGVMNDPSDAQQPSGNMISTGDNRISGANVQVGNKIYTVNGFDNGTGLAQVRFTVFDATTGNILQQGDINSPSLSYYYPSIAVNELGQAVIGFTGSGSSQFASSYAVVSTSTNGTLSFGTPTLVFAGGGNYANGSPNYRWGDYSAVTVDPADTGIFWSFQEVATSTLNVWATQASEIIPNIAGQVRWQAAASGNYSSAASWFGGVAPGAGSHAIYSRNGAPFTVTMPAGLTQNDRISVRQGNTTFNIAAGSTYQATNANSATPSFQVSQYLGDTTLTVTGGGTLSTVYTTLAAGENGLTTDNISKATVNINGATWNNSQDVYFGGNATRSGGQAQLNISNSGTVTVGQVARFWTSTSGVNLNGATPVNFNVGGLRADPGVNPLITGTGANANLNITNGLNQNYFGQISGTVNVAKSGVGTQTLSGNMNYTGTTTINGGRLNINGQKTGAGAVTVNNTGVLGGTGSVAGVSTVASGGKISPGLSPGNLTLTGGLNMVAGSYEWELAALTETGPGVNYDELTLDGGASVLGGTSQVELAFLNAVNPNVADPFWTTAHQWQIVDLMSGTLTGNFGSVANANFATGTFSLSGGNGGDIFLNFSPAPEPSSIALVGGSLVGLLIWRRRRSRSANGNQ